MMVWTIGLSVATIALATQLAFAGLFTVLCWMLLWWIDAKVPPRVVVTSVGHATWMFALQGATGMYAVFAAPVDLWFTQDSSFQELFAGMYALRSIWSGAFVLITTLLLWCHTEGWRALLGTVAAATTLLAIMKMLAVWLEMPAQLDV